jgi:hypothetical protein
MNQDVLRKTYKPNTIRLLFIGESLPAGGTFFYKADSNLFRYTQQAFATVFGNSIGSGDKFLQSFKDRGCYLEDLCPFPINHFSKPERRRYRRQAESDLVDRIRRASPQAIVVVMKAILPNVERALYRAGMASVPVCALPFPALGNQRRYVDGLVDLLQSLLVVLNRAGG